MGEEYFLFGQKRRNCSKIDNFKHVLCNSNIFAKRKRLGFWFNYLLQNLALWYTLALSTIDKNYVKSIVVKKKPLCGEPSMAGVVSEENSGISYHSNVYFN